MGNTHTNYYNTKWWKSRSEKAKKAVNYKCQQCNSTFKLKVCHINDDTFFNEKKKDLVVICGFCYKTRQDLFKNIEAHLDSIQGKYKYD